MIRSDPPRTESPDPPNRPAPADAPRAAENGNGDIYSMFWREDLEERRGLRLSLAGALVVHAILLMVTFPDVYSGELDAAEDQKVFVVQNVRYKPPPPAPVDNLPKPEARRVPIPDPDPDDPEPIRLEEPRTDLDLPPVDMDLVFGMPDAPPEPEQTTPYELGGDIRAPVRTHYVVPVYTEIARRTRTEGTVVLHCVITRDGRVTQIEVRKGLTMGLTEEAVKAVKQWRYKAATLNGKPVDVFLTLSVIFSLN